MLVSLRTASQPPVLIDAVRRLTTSYMPCILWLWKNRLLFPVLTDTLGAITLAGWLKNTRSRYQNKEPRPRGFFFAAAGDNRLAPTRIHT